VWSATGSCLAASDSWRWLETRSWTVRERAPIHGRIVLWWFSILSVCVDARWAGGWVGCVVWACAVMLWVRVAHACGAYITVVLHVCVVVVLLCAYVVVIRLSCTWVVVYVSQGGVVVSLPLSIREVCALLSRDFAGVLLVRVCVFAGLLVFACASVVLSLCACAVVVLPGSIESRYEWRVTSSLGAGAGFRVA
jgi:hypothetical protein